MCMQGSMCGRYLPFVKGRHGGDHGAETHSRRYRVVALPGRKGWPPALLLNRKQRARLMAL